MQPDGQYLPVAHNSAVFGKQESELRKLERKCISRMDAVLGIVLPVVFAEQARRNIDGNNRSARVVDMADQRNERLLQRAVQTSAEKAVNYPVILPDVGTKTGVGYF